MYLFRLQRRSLLMAGLMVSFTIHAEQFPVNLGTLLTEEEITRANITIYPDGQNLPNGQGSVLEGRKLYNDQCAFCHGESGTEGPAHRLAGSIGLFSIWDPLRIKRIMEVNGLLVMSTGQQWPYATTIFDFVRRAMPHPTAKSLSNNQVYAITGYILYLNDLVGEQDLIDKNNLPQIEMPAFKRFVHAQ